MILIRADSSFVIGTGHITRCLHLAGLLKSLGHQVEFVCAELPGNIISQISEKNFHVHSFPGDQKDEDIHLILKLKPSWLIVDHYGKDEHWEKKIHPIAKIFVIDDLMNRKHSCDVLLDQNYRRDFTPYRSLIPGAARLLGGPEFCLMDSNLKKASGAKVLSEKPKMLSFFGGSDSGGELLKLAKALMTAGFSYPISFVALKSHQHLESLKALKLPEHFSLVLDPPNWHELLANSDFYIGSGGTVTWERLFLGTPGAVIAVAENQEGASEDLADDGYQMYWGSHQKFDYSTAAEKITAALQKPYSLKEYSKKGLELVRKFDLNLAQEIFGLGQS